MVEDSKRKMRGESDDNQEAIDLLDNLIGMIEDNHGSDYDSAIRMAIDALTEPGIIIGGDSDEQETTQT